MAKKGAQKVEETALVTQKKIQPISVVTKADVTALKKQRELLRDFVSSQLVEAQFNDPKKPHYCEGDYGIIPGTKKRCLFKQGAEKMLTLFHFGSDPQLVDKTIDREANFAMFTYRVKVFHAQSNTFIAACDGSCNSQEKKYKERTVYTKKKVGGKQVTESHMEETPIFDILNTLQKMAQKRALVGATLLATGASEYFTQDMLDEEDLKQYGHKDKEEDDDGERDVSPAAAGAAPECCGRSMMISKYEDRDLGHKPWYCVKCGKKVPVEGEGP
jgi:hypothetical protein